MVNNVFLIYDNLSYLIGLTFRPEVLWNVIPLLIAMILIIIYFGVFRGEKPGWESYVSNTLVLLFVSMGLLRYIYELGGNELGNLIDFPAKTGAALFLLLISLLLLRFNFSRVFPKRISGIFASNITVNLVAYAMILFVYADRAVTWQIIVALVILVVLLDALFNLTRKPLTKLNDYFEELKLKERLENVREAKFQIEELKKEEKEREEELKEIKKKEVVKKERELKYFRKVFRGLFGRKHHKHEKSGKKRK
jgi:hypothetical protein